MGRRAARRRKQAADQPDDRGPGIPRNNNSGVTRKAKATWLKL